METPTGDLEVRPPRPEAPDYATSLVEELTQQDQIITSWFLDTGNDPRGFAMPAVLDFWRYAA